MTWWHRLWVDFMPLDKSTIGPNLLASLVTAGLVILHNEWRILRRDSAHHDSLRQILRDELAELEHPAEAVEEKIADKVQARCGAPTVRGNPCQNPPTCPVHGKDPA